MADDNNLRLAVITSVPFEQNTYIGHFADRSECIVVDPGLEPAKILAYLDEHQLTPAALLITHGHGDHIGGNASLKNRWPDCPLVIARDEAAKLTNPHLNLSADFGVPLTSPPADVLLEHGQRYAAAGFDLEVRAIPGHSSGHVVFVWHDHEPPIVFGGDVLFAGSVGRTDLVGGSFEQLAEGIREQLFTLPDETIVLPGHGPPTTVGQEKRSNPYVGSG